MEVFVKIRAGYDIAFQCPYAVPMVLMLTTHPSRDGDIIGDQRMRFSPGVDARDFFDPYGNICTRLVAPPGLLEVRSDFIVEDSGLPDEVCPAAQQWDVGSLPGEVFPFLLASRYCDTEKLSNLAWSLFGGIEGGWQRAQAKKGGGFSETGSRYAAHDDSDGFDSASSPSPWRAREESPRRLPLTIEGELVAKSTGTISAFTLGDRVFHQKFGNGNVTAIDGNKLTIQFDRAGEKRVVDSFVERV